MQLQLHQPEATASDGACRRVRRSAASYIQRVARVCISIRGCDARVMNDPGVATDYAIPLRHDRQHLVYFEPAKEHMQIRSVRRVPPATGNRFGAAEPAEE